MPASIPNDIYQYSTITALRQGLTTAGPPIGALTNHGTHGTGLFPNGDPMILVDGKAWRLSVAHARRGANEKEAPHWHSAASDADRLPFTMVTVFSPSSFASTQSTAFGFDELRDLLTNQGPEAGGKNSYMPFRVRGHFSSVRVRLDRRGRELSDQEASTTTIHDVLGTLFGFCSPAWAGATSPSGVQCCFLGADLEGGEVTGFAAGRGVSVEWAVCGRFHLGLPQGKAWEALDL